MRSAALAAWLVGLAAVGVGGCAVFSSGPEDLPPARLSRPPDARIRGQPCRYVTAPAELPPFDGLARPGTRGSLALLGRGMSPADSVEFSARYDAEGRLIWVRPIRSTIPEESVVPMANLLFESLEERGPEDWGFRMLVAGGDLVAVAPSVHCPPEARAGLQPNVSAPVVSARDYQLLDRIRGRRFPARITLDERGRIIGIRLISPTGDDVIDRFVMDYFMQLRFEPKLHDGIPVPATVVETMRMRRGP